MLLTVYFLGMFVIVAIAGIIDGANFFKGGDLELLEDFLDQPALTSLVALCWPLAAAYALAAYLTSLVLESFDTMAAERAWKAGGRLPAPRGVPPQQRTPFDDFFDEQMADPALAELYRQARSQIDKENAGGCSSCDGCGCCDDSLDSLSISDTDEEPTQLAAPHPIKVRK